MGPSPPPPPTAPGGSLPSPGASYVLAFSCGAPVGGGARGGLEAQGVEVAFSVAHGRAPHPADARIQEVWDARLLANPRMFDASKFRLKRAEWVGGGGAGGAGGGGMLRLELGLTGYKEYVGTNLRPRAEFEELIASGVEHHGDDMAHISNALGCEAVLLTADGKAVLLRRSKEVTTSCGQYNGPSGHPEPSDAGLGGGGGEGAEEGAAVNEAVRRELFASVVKETVEETGVEAGSLSEPRLIGIMRDKTGKPDLLFLVRCSLTAEEVRGKYALAVDGWESDRMLSVDPTDRGSWGEGVALTAVTDAAMECLACV